MFADVIGEPLAVWQADALRLETRLTVLCAGRQMGKSRGLAVLALWWAFRRREQHVLIVSASDHAARRVLALAASMARGSELLERSVVDSQRALLSLSNGSVIRSVAASEAAVRGWSVDLGLLDEAGLASDELVLEAFMPTMAARPDARAVLAGSATRAAGAFYDLFRVGELGDEHIRSFRQVSKAAGGDCNAPWISHTQIALDQAAMSPARFDAEHRGVFAGGGSALFTPAALARMFVDYVPDTLGTMGGEGRVSWGQDWGAVADRSAGVALGRIPQPGGGRLFAVRAVRRWDAGASLPGVVEEIAASPAHFQAVCPEQNGLGQACCQLLWSALERRPFTAGGGRRQSGSVMVEEKGWDPVRKEPRVRRPKFAGFVTERRPVVTSAQSKAATWSAIRLGVDLGQLIAPASEVELRRELALLEVGLTQMGVEKIEAAHGHDDLCDALYLACAPFRRQSGEWTCSLTELMDPRTLLPAVPVPPEVAASPHVDGPDGLRIPVRPAWQSITGAGLTVPQGLDFATRVDPWLSEVRAGVRTALSDNNREVVDHAG